jgi:hypothetical protein
MNIEKNQDVGEQRELSENILLISGNINYLECFKEFKK